MIRKAALLAGVSAALMVIGCGREDASGSGISAAVKGGQDPVTVAILGPGASFGRALAVARDVVAVGAFEELPGMVMVYERRASGWALAATLSVADLYEPDMFGRSLALGKDRLVVGAPEAAGSGRVYVFERQGASWSLAAELSTPLDGIAGFGRAVALDGDTLLVGAPRRDEGGLAFVYERRGDAWVEADRLAPDVRLGRDEFGTAVSLSAGRAIVGAPYAPLGNAPGGTVGAAYVFVREAAGWRQEAALVEPEVEDVGVFGLSVAIGPGVLVVTCDCPDGDGYVFELVGGTWTPVATLHAGWGNVWSGFGHEAALANGHVFLTAPFREDGGRVLRWERAEQGWLADGELELSGATPGLGVGHAVAAADDLVVVGVPAVSEESGAVWIFPRGAR